MSVHAEGKYRAAKERLSGAPDDLGALREFSEAARAFGKRPEALEALKAAYAKRPTPELYAELRMVCTFPEFQAIAKPPESGAAPPKQAGSGAEILPRKPFPLLLDQVLFYPVQDGQSIFILVVSALLMSFGHLLGFAMGGIAISATVICFGLVYGYLWTVMTASGMGEKHTRGWPDLSSPEEFGSAIGQYFMVSLLCFGPSLFLIAWPLLNGETPGVERVVAGLGLAVLGLLYYPMALMLTGFTHNVGETLNFPAAIRSIAKIPLDYVICLGFFIVSFVAVCVIEWVILSMSAKVPIPVLLVLMIFLRAINVYMLIVQMRTVGLLYYSREKDLGWFQ
ncbi:MAG TPA: hypothetical protein VFC90_11825 [Planctomycetota bacterium]|nr:hypothetical protein [Planctomycetota bacterium]